MRKKPILAFFAVLLVVSLFPVVSAEYYEQNQIYGSDSYNVTFNGSPYSEIVNITIPRRANITGAEWDLTGYIGNNITGDDWAWLYQENASSVLCSGTWHATYTCSNAYDDNWTTFGESADWEDYAYLYTNYTKKVGANNGQWRAKIGTGGATNRTISDACFSQSPLQFRMRSLHYGPSGTRNDCWNGTEWENIFSTGDAGPTENRYIYEEAVWWNVSTYPENVTIDTANNGENDYMNDTIFNTTETAYMNATAIMDYLRYTCTADWDTGNCVVPFNASSVTAGILGFTAMNVSGSLRVPIPNITIIHDYTLGLNETLTATTNITVASDGYENVTCNITINGDSYPNENYTVPTMTGNYTFTLIDGTNTITVNCTNDMNLSTYEVETFTRYLKYYVLINEETGDPYVITTENVTISVPSLGISYNFSAGEDAIYFVLNESTDVRFEIEYEGITGVITRDFNTGLAETNETRVCMAEEQTFYEQILYTSSRTALELKATLANCLLIQDYTKFAYTNALMARTFTVPIMYELHYWNSDGNKTFLGRLDGGIASSTNIDLIELKSREYVITVLTEGVSISALTNNTLKFFYYNPSGNNDEIIVTIRNGTNVLYTVTVTDTPNEYTFTWDHNMTDITDMLLTIEVEKFIDGESMGSITRIFYANGLSGSLNPAVALLISGVLVFFGLTFVAVRFVFGYFGIITMVMALAILTQAPANQYIILMQAIEVIMLVFIIFLMKGEYAKRQIT